jgi:hypothetical protein
VLIWDPTAGTLKAFKSGSPAAVWETNRGSWSMLSYRPWQPIAFLSSAKSMLTVPLNLRSGKAGSRLSTELSMWFSKAWAAFPLGSSHVLALQEGLVLTNLESGRLFPIRGFTATLMTQVEDLVTLTTRDDNAGWLTRTEFLTLITRIDSILLEIEQVEREKWPVQIKSLEINKRRQQISVLADQLEKGIKLFRIPGGLGRNTGRPGTSFCHVPGTYLHLIGANLWQIGPDRVTKVGCLEPLWHSTSHEGWISAGHSTAAQRCAMPSPDGRYAVTATHLHDLKDLKAVAELPFPTGPAGFTSKGKKIYAYDAKHRRLVFLSLEDVLRERKDGAPERTTSG